MVVLQIKFDIHVVVVLRHVSFCYFDVVGVNRYLNETEFVLFFANARNNPASKEPNPSTEYAADILLDALAVDVVHNNERNHRQTDSHKTSQPVL